MNPCCLSGDRLPDSTAATTLSSTENEQEQESSLAIPPQPSAQYEHGKFIARIPSNKLEATATAAEGELVDPFSSSSVDLSAAASSASDTSVSSLRILSLVRSFASTFQTFTASQPCRNWFWLTAACMMKRWRYSQLCSRLFLLHSSSSTFLTSRVCYPMFLMALRMLFLHCVTAPYYSISSWDRVLPARHRKNSLQRHLSRLFRNCHSSVYSIFHMCAAFISQSFCQLSPYWVLPLPLPQPIPLPLLLLSPPLLPPLPLLLSFRWISAAIILLLLPYFSIVVVLISLLLLKSRKKL